MGKQKSQKSAAARTLNIPGVDTREQEDRNPPSIKLGPSIERCWVDPPNSQRCLHYRTIGNSRKTLCGMSGPQALWDFRRDGTRRVCQACHVKASVERAVLR